MGKICVYEHPRLVNRKTFNGAAFWGLVITCVEDFTGQ